jgi:hypothetical protein
MNRTILNPHPGIRIDRIPANGGVEGLMFTIATFVVFMAVPQVRDFLLIGLAGGIPTAALIYFWRNQTRW